MHFFALLTFSGVVLFWIINSARLAIGVLRLPQLDDFSPVNEADAPRVSLLFAARDEQEKLPGALATLAMLDYPKLEIIGVDDRSEDNTGKILDDFASSHQNFRAVHVDRLPAGWLGKPHALQQAFEKSTGEWLLFTDADVRFKPDALRRAISIVNRLNLDHLTLFGDIEMIGFWETVAISFFGLAFHIATNPGDVSNPRSRTYMGVGAFQLIRRSVYEASGTHRRLAMEVIDDMKLGKIVKQTGFRSSAGLARDSVVVRWHAGARNVIQGVTKNFFAATGFSIAYVIISVAGLLITNVLPLAGIVFGHGWVRMLAAAGMLVAIALHAAVCYFSRVSPLYGLSVPLGAILFCYMLLRSTFFTIRQRGIVWRGTFYPLEALKRGMV
jgi:glycosyltransferase involved in cell wall biosynthesis